jgi:tRNA pseudouridine55 synthase
MPCERSHHWRIPIQTLLQLDGFLVIDKPEGMTSHDVVQVVRRRLALRKVGHLGTLDPMATGVLPLALGKATRLVDLLKGGRKVYEGTIRLGFSTNTYDREGKPASDVMEVRVTQKQLSQHAAGMLGDKLQMPPPFSAKKLQGVPAYRLARQGKPVPLTACPVHIDALSFTLSGSRTDEVEFTICCSAGTYVRSVAHDLGINLGCGAHLVRLRRTGSGEFSLEQSMSLPGFNQASIEDLTARLIPLNSVLSEYPALQVDAETEEAIVSGKVFSCGNVQGQPHCGTSWHRVLSSEGLLIALAKPVAAADASDSPSSTTMLFHPTVVLITKGNS